MNFDTLSAQAAPGFDRPLDVLLACHGRIEAQCATLEKLTAHLAANGCDTQAQQAARAILKYFDTAALDHHDDEERNLFPLLEAAGGDCCELVELLTHEHDELALLWRALRAPLNALAQGEMAAVNAGLATRFASLNRSHIAFENARVLPLAREILRPADIERLGRAMAARRGVAYPTR